MMGLVTQTFGDMRVRAASIATHDVSGATLAKLSGPTEEDPFQNLSVMWMVGEQGWPLSMIVRPRDFVILCASGVMTRTNGERIGYDMVLPAPLPQCGPLPKPMTRGKLMYGALYREMENGTVDVYIQLYVETMGHVLDAIVMNAMWISTLGFWKAPHVAEEKKLRYCIMNCVKNPNTGRQRVVRSTWADLSRCDICKEKIGRFGKDKEAMPSGTNSCALCATLLCSRCRVKRSFRVLTGRRKGPPTRRVSVVVCRGCMDFVHQQCSADIAWQLEQQRLTQAASDSGRTTWGLLDDAMTPSWSPGRHLSMSEFSYSFSDRGDAGSVYSVP